MPPATATSMSPVAIPCAASMTALSPEPHTLLMVRAPTWSGRPAPRAACRAGACPRPAETTLPMMHSSTASGSMPARVTASRTTRDPRSVAGRSLSAPRNLPVGSRTALAMTAARMMLRSFARYVQLPDHTRSQQLRQPLADHAAGPVRLAAPGIGCRADRQGAVRTQPHDRHAGQRGADGRGPRKADLGVGERLPAQHVAERTCRAVPGRGHYAECIIRAVRQESVARPPLGNESGEAPASRGATREHAGLHVTEEQQSEVGSIAGRMQRGSCHGLLVLASRSPRRARLLREAGYEIDIVPADIDESRLAGEAPRQYVLRVAAGKAAAVAPVAGDRIVVAADTVVLIDGLVLGKPANRREAVSMLERLSGRTHEVLTGVAVVRGTRVLDAVEVTRVTFATLDRERIAWYAGTGEPDDKAGPMACRASGRVSSSGSRARTRTWWGCRSRSSTGSCGQSRQRRGSRSPVTAPDAPANTCRRVDGPGSRRYPVRALHA